jgi:hypothetical protein
MKNLKEYIYESLLDDEEDILDKQDKKLLDSVKWFYDKSLECKNWDQLYKLIKEFKSLLDFKNNATELQPSLPRPKQGIYSKYWELQSVYRFTNKDLLCRINLNLNGEKESPADMHMILAIGYGKSNVLRLWWQGNKPKWGIGGKDTMNVLIRNDWHMYLIKPESYIKSSYDPMAEELGIKH